MANYELKFDEGTVILVSGDLRERNLLSGDQVYLDLIDELVIEGRQFMVQTDVTVHTLPGGQEIETPVYSPERLTFGNVDELHTYLSNSFDCEKVEKSLSSPKL